MSGSTKIGVLLLGGFNTSQDVFQKLVLQHTAISNKLPEDSEPILLIEGTNYVQEKAPLKEATPNQSGKSNTLARPRPFLLPTASRNV